MSRQDNWLTNELAQQASGYHVDRGMFFIAEKPMLVAADSEKAGSGEPADKEDASSDKPADKEEAGSSKPAA